MKDKELKSCPFCGSSYIETMYNDTLPTSYWCICMACDAEGPYKDTLQEAIDAWNERV